MAYISVENLSKIYRIPKVSSVKNNFREIITGGIKRIWNQSSHSDSSSQFQLVRALDDVSFTLSQGDVLGVVGNNGSGKSTLLKLLSRITSPTSGRIRLNGRVSSLLEVGTGFHPELTGRENIYMNGVILGMSRHEIAQRFEEIVEFSGVGKFLDTPVKRYSSGMLLRLAFSVAAHLDPEIMIVDEVLAVGDHKFQKKCMNTMNRLGSTGRTILFVSHNLGAVRKLCTKALHLDKGKLVNFGEVNDVIRAYLMQEKTVKSMHHWTHKNPLENEIIALHSIKTVNHRGECRESFSIHETINVEIEYTVKTGGNQILLGIDFIDSMGTNLFLSVDTSSTEYFERKREVGVYRSVCKIPKDFFNEGDIFVNLRVVQNGTTMVLSQVNVITFSIIDDLTQVGARGDFSFSWPHVAVRPRLEWKIERQSMK